MRKILLAAIALLIVSVGPLRAANPGTTIKITSFTAVKDPNFALWTLTVTGTMSLDANATKIASQSFYFRDPGNNQQGATISNPTLPGPGQTVPFTFGPVTNPTTLIGTWTAQVSVTDDLKPIPTYAHDSMQTKVGP